MKEVEFINSRVEDGRSQPSKVVYLVTAGTSDASSEPTRISPSLTHGERNAILSVLRHFRDILTIYRFTIERNVQNTALRQDFKRNQELINVQENGFYATNIIEDLIKDVEINGNYNVLIREIEDKRKIRDDEIALARDYTKARQRVDELRKLMEEETKANVGNREKLRAQLVRSKNENKISELKVDNELRYTRVWERARSDNTYLRYSIALKNLGDTLANLCSKEKNECRVFTEIEAFLQENITANERAASQWQKRYEREMLIYESENERFDAEIENRREALKQLWLEYREKQEFIERYIEEKETDMKRKKREEHRRDCSIRIQAWWRGVIVRRKLGPYRLNERKKKRAVKSKK